MWILDWCLYHKSTMWRRIISRTYTLNRMWRNILTGKWFVWNINAIFVTMCNMVYSLGLKINFLIIGESSRDWGHINLCCKSTNTSDKPPDSWRGLNVLFFLYIRTKSLRNINCTTEKYQPHIYFFSNLETIYRRYQPTCLYIF